MTYVRKRRTPRALVAATLTICMISAPASAQRAVAAGITVVPSASIQVRDRLPQSSAVAQDTSNAVTSGQSHAVAIGAIAGAILGAWYGHGGGGNCDGSSDTQAHCRQTLLIGGTAVGAVLGALAGHLIELGEERDAKRAARARADSASTPAPSHP